MTGAPEEADIVVIGAGHNALICAAYLAAAGLQVVVLEARDRVGGNTVTEELTLPGFAHDSCSSAHVLIQSNPVLRDDELGLQSTYGLTYVKSDPAVVLCGRDGQTVVIHRDLAATAEEFARISPPDAAEFTTAMTEWTTTLSAAHDRWNAGLPPTGDQASRTYEALRLRPAWEVIHERFTHPVIRDALLWLGFATIRSPLEPGSGVLPLAITAGRLRHGWATPLGGSGALPTALVRQLHEHGGTVLTDAAVTSIEVRNGRAAAVRTADGRRVAARQAIVSSAHLAVLMDLLAADVPAPDLRRAQASWRPGLSLFAVHAALRGELTYPTSDGPTRSVAGGLGSAAGLADQLTAFDRGQPDARDPWLLLVSSTVADPARAPAGHETLKLLTVAPYTLSGGRSWAARAEEHAAALMALVRRRTGLSESDILAVVPETPEGLAARNPANLGGSCHGGEFANPDGPAAAGWTSYRASLPGLFLTGSTTHPGGSVSGRPGRNAARTILTDLGIDPGLVMGAP